MKIVDIGSYYCELGIADSVKKEICGEERNMYRYKDFVDHEFKTLPKHFNDVASGIKKFEVRKDDRGCKAGDMFALLEWNPETGYTGNVFVERISYILRDCPEYGLMDGYCIFCW